MAEVLTTNEVATQLGTDPKTLRKFFRSDKCDVVPVGQGKRYALTARDVKKLAPALEAWHTSNRTPKPKTDEAEVTETPAPKKRGRKAKQEPVVELEDIDEELDEDPTDEELLEVDDELTLDD